MDLRDITVTWMDDREETYRGVSTRVHESVLHIYQYTSITNALRNEWHIPLANIRIWNPRLGQEN